MYRDLEDLEVLVDLQTGTITLAVRMEEGGRVELETVGSDEPFAPRE